MIHTKGRDGRDAFILPHSSHHCQVVWRIVHRTHVSLHITSWGDDESIRDTLVFLTLLPFNWDFIRRVSTFIATVFRLPFFFRESKEQENCDGKYAESEMRCMSWGKRSLSEWRVCLWLEKSNLFDPLSKVESWKGAKKEPTQGGSIPSLQIESNWIMNLVPRKFHASSLVSIVFALFSFSYSSSFPWVLLIRSTQAKDMNSILLIDIPMPRRYNFSFFDVAVHSCFVIESNTQNQSTK